MPANPRSLSLLDAYHDQLSRLRAQTTQLVVRRHAVINPEDLTSGYQMFVTDAARIIEAGQRQAATYSDALLKGFVRLEAGRDEEITEPVEDNAGFTTDGRRLTEVLAAVPAKVFLAIKLGKSTEDALAFGRFAASRTAVTEVMDAASQELTHQMKESPSVGGWRWKSRGTCGACLAMDSGQVLSLAQPLNRHPYCQCVAEPVVKGVRERVKRETGPERFKSLPVAKQDAMLGQKAKWLRAGAIAWKDLVNKDTSAEWHPVLVETALKELEQIAN